ncbi:tetratricopeptide repeat protein [bacterium]|nr:tetratricopeptide repeat protein [bacterium]
MENTISPAIQQLISSAELLEKDNKTNESFLKYEEAIDALLILDNEVEIKDLYEKITYLDSNQLTDSTLKKRQMVFINIIHAEKLYQEEQIDGALKILEKTKKEHPNNPEILAKLGLIYERQSQKEKAIENYFTAAEYYHNHQFLKKAYYFAQKAKHISPQRNDIKILLAEIHIKDNSKEEARKELIDLVKNFVRQNAFDEALKYVQKALQVDGVETLYLEAVIWFHKGLSEAAEQKFKLVTRLKGGHFGSLCYLGEIYLRQNQFQEAFNAYQKAFTLRPWDTKIYHKLAEINLQKEEHNLDPEEKSKIKSTSAFSPGKTEDSLLPFDSSSPISPDEEKTVSLEETQTYSIESEIAMKQSIFLPEIIALYEFVINLDSENEETKKKLQALKTFQKEKEKQKKEIDKKPTIIDKNFENEFWPLNIIEVAEFPSLIKEVINLYRSFLKNSSNNELLNRLNKVQLLSNKRYLDIKINS